MNSFDFVRRIDHDHICEIMAKFFDEIMVLYNLVGDKKDIIISTDTNCPSTKFILLMNTEKDAIELFNNLNNMVFTVYDDKFVIEMELSGRYISTVIYKAIS